jgi:methylmalonyl-CoA epimerase
MEAILGGTIRISALTSRGEAMVKYKRIEHIAIAVRNLDAVRDTLDRIGLQCTHEETLPGPGVRLAMLPVGESALELIESSNPNSQTSRWIRDRGEGLYHVCLEVDDIEAALDELRDKGVKLIDQVPRSGHGGHRIAFLDPSSTAGILIELVQMSAEAAH